MPIILSEHEWDKRWNADPTATEDYSQLEPFETLHRWRCQLETGWRRIFSLGGLWLKIEEYQCAEDCILQHEVHGCMPVSSFFIGGILKNCHHGLTDEILEHPGHHYLEGIQDGIESDYFTAEETVYRVRFGLRSDVMQRFEQIVERAIWMQRGWDWLNYGKAGRTIAIDETQDDEWDADWATVQIDFQSPDQKISGRYEAKVETWGRVMTQYKSGTDQPLDPVKQYRVTSLELVQSPLGFDRSAQP